MTRRLLIACALGLALFAAGCDEESKPASKATYAKDVAASFLEPMDETRQLTKLTPRIGSARSFAGAATGVTAAYREATWALASIRPPAEIEGLHEALVVATARLARNTRDAQRRAASGRAKTVAGFVRATERYRRDIAPLIPEFRAKGYTMRSSALGKL